MKKDILLIAGVLVTVFTIGLTITTLTVRHLELKKDYQRLKDSLPRLIREYTQLQRDFIELKKEKTFKSLDVIITAYEPVESQTDSTPYVMASGKRVTEEELKGLRFAAVSRDLLKKFNPEAPLDFKKLIWIPWIIEDTMHERYTNRVDLFMEEGRAKDFGIQERSILYIDK